MTSEFSDVSADRLIDLFNPVDNPRHYAGDGTIDCFRAFRLMISGYKRLSALEAIFWFNAFKYLWRWKLKGGLTDLRKCQRMIDMLINEVYRSKSDEKDGLSDQREDNQQCSTKTR